MRTILLLSLSLLIGMAQAGTLTNKNTKFSIHVGSYVKHFIPKDNNFNFTEEFDNKFFDIEYKLDENKFFDRITVGTFLNSEENRCAVFGVQKDWKNITDKLAFEGMYAYVGEFFFDAFEHCADQGIYRKIKRFTGLGFAPYIYHGLEYSLNKHISLEVGFVAPFIVVSSIQLNF